MTQNTKTFLRDPQILDLVDTYQFQHIYDLANDVLSENEVREMTLFFIGDIGINPLEHMTRVPASYFSKVNTPKVILPSTIESIDDNAFTDANIASLYLSRSLKRFSDEAFNDCNVAVVCLPGTIADYINNVDIDAYAGAYNGAFKLGDSTGNIIQDIIITSAVNTTYSHHFQDCISIQTVKFDSGVQTIPHYAFSGCHNLTTVELPKTITSIGEEAFAYCVNLNKIIYEGTKDEFDRITFFPEWLSNGDGTEHWFTLNCTDRTYSLEAGK